MPQPTSVKYYHDIDLAKSQLLNAKLHPIQTADRVTLGSSLNINDEALTVYDIQEDAFYVWDGNNWLQIKGLTDEQLDWLVQAYDKAITSVEVTSTETERTITLVHQDTTTMSDTYTYAYIHTQTVANTEWTITHNLGKYPSVSVVDTADEEVIGEVVYLDNNSLKVKFTAAFSGKAYIN